MAHTAAWTSPSGCSPTPPTTRLTTSTHHNGDEVTHWYYITGAGRPDARSELEAGAHDKATGILTGSRVLIMVNYLYTYINRLEQAARASQPINGFLNLDLVGFSRGAAEARIFANLVDRFLAGDDEFTVIDDAGWNNEMAHFDTDTQASAARAFLLAACIDVNLRFLGLWDTVAHIGGLEYNDSKESYGGGGDAYLGIPERVGYTAQAVAANERRAIFDGMSILDHPGDNDPDKIERGFIGDHTDIGGSNGRTDLSDVAFMWMVQQATRKGGVPESAIDFVYLKKKKWNIVTTPRVTDTVYDAPSGIPDALYQPGRYFRYLDGGGDTDVLQIDWTDPDMDFASSLAFLEKDIYQDTNGIWGDGVFFGADEMLETPLRTINGRYLYKQWLAEHYNLDIEFSDDGLEENTGNTP